ncbi:MAG: hypothetical protein JJU36_14955 [Phycisphaeraceae bacterium]|nr:hypothetical protein [Phycisphaeraceae bacterium]
MKSTASSTGWTGHGRTFLGRHVGTLAWMGRMLLGGQREVAVALPSLLVLEEDLGESELREVGKRSDGMPRLMILAEPAFMRRLRADILRRIDWMGGGPPEAVLLRAEDVSELKGGMALQTLLDLRSSGAIGSFGFMHDDVRSVEWLVENTGPFVLGMPWSRDDQQAAYRAVPKALEYGIDCLGVAGGCATWTGDDWAFALGGCARILTAVDRLPSRSALPPTHARLIDDAALDVALPLPWDEAQMEVQWDRYQQSHQPPEPLPRSRPPMGE